LSWKSCYPRLQASHIIAIPPQLSLSSFYPQNYLRISPLAVSHPYTRPQALLSLSSLLPSSRTLRQPSLHSPRSPLSLRKSLRALTTFQRFLRKFQTKYPSQNRSNPTFTWCLLSPLCSHWLRVGVNSAGVASMGKD